MMKRELRWRLLGLFLLAILAGCSSNNPTPTTPGASVLFYHAAPINPVLNVSVDGKQLNSQGFDYGNTSGYIQVDAGKRQMRLSSISSGSVLIDTTFELAENKGYSFFVVNKPSSTTIKPLVTIDQGVLAVKSNMAVRLIHLSPDTPAVYLVPMGETTAIFSGQTFQKITTFTEIPVKNYTFEIRAVSDNHVLATTTQMTPTAGAFYSIMLMGYSSPPPGNTNTLMARFLAN